MYICMCNGVTESAIKRAVAAGISTLGELAVQTGCTAGCGCCTETAAACLQEALYSESMGDSMRALLPA